MPSALSTRGPRIHYHTGGCELGRNMAYVYFKLRDMGWSYDIGADKQQACQKVQNSQAVP